MFGNLSPRTVVLEIFAPMHLVEGLACVEAIASGVTPPTCGGAA